MLSAITSIWNAIVNLVGSIVDFVMTIWNNVVGPVLGSVIETVKTIVNMVIGTIVSALIKPILSTDILNNEPTFLIPICTKYYGRAIC